MSKASGEKYHYILAISHTDHLIVGAFKLLRSPKVIPAPTPKQPQRIRLAWADPETPHPAEDAQGKYYEPIHELAGKDGQMIELGIKIVNGQPVRNIKQLVYLDQYGDDQLTLSRFGRLQKKLES